LIQKLVNINRIKNQDIHFQKGANWFSITHSLAKYILSKEASIEKTFKLSCYCDEMFVQTLVYNSDFKYKLYNQEFNNNYLSCMRYIDWNGGNPYVWKINDYKELINSEYLFARKFDYNIDRYIVDKISEKLTERINK